MQRVKVTHLFLSLLICLSAGAIGSIFTVSAIPNWYASLNKPFFNPPNWIFGPVWTVLYILMGVALYVIWQEKTTKPEKKQSFIFFFMQLFLNSMWSIIFFGLHSPLLALVVITTLWIMIFLTIKTFLKISRTAGWLLIPYLLWVSFATLLNFYIVLLNR